MTHCAEYFKILRSVGVGFVIMGFVGFVVKVSHLTPSSLVRIRCFHDQSPLDHIMRLCNDQDSSLVLMS